MEQVDDETSTSHRILAPLNNFRVKGIFSDPKSKTIRDIKWAFISTVTASLAHFILRTIIGRELGSDGLGIYTLAFTIYLLGMQFAAFGIGPALTRYIAEHLGDRQTINSYVSSGLTGSIITGTAMGVILFLLSPYLADNVFHTPELEIMIRLISFCFPFIAVQKAVLGTLNGLRRMRHFAFLNIMQNGAVVIISIVLVLLFDLGEMGAVIGLVIPTIASSILCPILIRDCISLNKSMWDMPALRATTAFGFYVVLSNSIGFLNTQIDSILIGYYLNPSDVGIYAVAVLLAQTLTLIPTAVQQVTAPITANLYGKGDVQGVWRLFHSTLKKSLTISAITAIVVAVTAPYIIDIIFTEAYALSYTPLLVLLVGYAIGASYGAVGATLSSIGKVKVAFRISAICATFNILLNMLLIPAIGIIGAAIATAGTMILNFLMTVWIARNFLKGEPKDG